MVTSDEISRLHKACSHKHGSTKSIIFLGRFLHTDILEFWPYLQPNPNTRVLQFKFGVSRFDLFAAEKLLYTFLEEKYVLASDTCKYKEPPGLEDTCSPNDKPVRAYMKTFDFIIMHIFKQVTKSLPCVGISVNLHSVDLPKYGFSSLPEMKRPSLPPIDFILDEFSPFIVSVSFTLLNGFSLRIMTSTIFTKTVRESKICLFLYDYAVNFLVVTNNEEVTEFNILSTTTSSAKTILYDVPAVTDRSFTESQYRDWASLNYPLYADNSYFPEESCLELWSPNGLLPSFAPEDDDRIYSTPVGYIPFKSATLEYCFDLDFVALPFSLKILNIRYGKSSRASGYFSFFNFEGILPKDTKKNT